MNHGKGALAALRDKSKINVSIERNFGDPVEVVGFAVTIPVAVFSTRIAREALMNVSASKESERDS